MDSSDVIMNDAIEHWLEQWERWLHLWLECGVTAPSPLAAQALRDWAADSDAAGWSVPGLLAEVLLDPVAAATMKADALLDLMGWYQAARRIHQARCIGES